MSVLYTLNTHDSVTKVKWLNAVYEVLVYACGVGESTYFSITRDALEQSIEYMY